MTREDGLARLLKFLSVLTERGIDFRLEQRSPDSISVDFGLVGLRIEADFDVEMMQYSIYRGDESVAVDAGKLLQLIAGQTD